MANVLLGVTGSVAAIYTPELVTELQAVGHTVKTLATRSALYFFDPLRIGAPQGQERDRHSLFLDDDEWPGDRYQRGAPVLHIELRRWADILLVAPLDAHTLAKFALGLCDNTLTCVYRAWDRTRPVILCPAMNTLMWDHPATARHLAQVQADLGQDRVNVVGPIAKKLACEDVGMGAMDSRDHILAAVASMSAPPES